MSPDLLLSFILVSTINIPSLALPSPASPAPSIKSTNSEFIRTSCSATLYPSLCIRSLSHYADAVQCNPVALARAAANVSLARVRSLSFLIANLTRTSTSAARVAAALHDCKDSLEDATDQIQQSADEIGLLEAAGGQEVAWRVSNVQTWMSAALTNEDTCEDGFRGVRGSASPVKLDVCWRVRRAKRYTSNALALVNGLVAKR